MAAGFVVKNLKDAVTGQAYSIKFYDDGTTNLTAVAPFGAATDSKLESVRALLATGINVADSNLNDKLTALNTLNTNLLTAIGSPADIPWSGADAGSLIAVMKSLALASGVTPAATVTPAVLDFSDENASGYAAVLGF